jgi:predicted amidophosphoribosyltransferase
MYIKMNNIKLQPHDYYNEYAEHCCIRCKKPCPEEHYICPKCVQDYPYCCPCCGVPIRFKTNEDRNQHYILKHPKLIA